MHDIYAYRSAKIFLQSMYGEYIEIDIDDIEKKQSGVHVEV